MRLSVNSLKTLYKEFSSVDSDWVFDTDELIQKIGAQLAAVEDTISFGDKYLGALVVRVVECADHPNADRLHLCKIDDGGVTSSIERDNNGHIQVVCGAPNVHSGMLAVWLPPGTKVPSTYLEPEPFVMESRDIRGQKSNGMMASPKELALGDWHEGILEITDEIKPGTTFVDAYNLNGETIIDLENKMFTHRPDCFGWLGLAREVAGIYGKQYKSPDWYKQDPIQANTYDDVLPLKIRNEIPELVPRFVALNMSGVNVRPSPLYIQLELIKAGIRPINNIVDMTNLIMIWTAQPIHAYDYDKVKSLSSSDVPELIIRYPVDGEKITLLNGKTLILRQKAMMVATDKKLICLGGAMGGSDTEVDGNSKNIILEAANWDMYNMRRTSMESGIFTDAVTRFTKGQSPLQNIAVTMYLAKRIEEVSGAKIASKLYDDNHLSEEVMNRGNLYSEVSVTADFINVRLGLSLNAADMQKILNNVEFDVAIKGDNLIIKAPFWRTDIAIPEDIVEEVGRLYGYDKLPLELPRRDLAPAVRNSDLDLKDEIRKIFSGLGANEVLTYNFVHGKLFEQSYQDKTKAFQIINAISPELQYYRTSLTPSLLERVHANIKNGYLKFVLFELNKVHIKDKFDVEGLPIEFDRFAISLASEHKSNSGSPFYAAKMYLNELKAVGLLPNYDLQPLSRLASGISTDFDQTFKPYEPKRSAVIFINGNAAGIVGEYRRSVSKTFKLPEYCAGFELDMSKLLKLGLREYTPISKFPGIEQDLCLKVNADLSYAELNNFLNNAFAKDYVDKRVYSLSPVDIYQKSDDKDHKQITFRLNMTSYERTLTDKEINLLMDEIAAEAAAKFQAEKI